MFFWSLSWSALCQYLLPSLPTISAFQHILQCSAMGCIMHMHQLCSVLCKECICISYVLFSVRIQQVVAEYCCQLKSLHSEGPASVACWPPNERLVFKGSLFWMAHPSMLTSAPFSWDLWSISAQDKGILTNTRVKYVTIRTEYEWSLDDHAGHHHALSGLSAQRWKVEWGRGGFPVLKRNCGPGKMLY